MSMTRLPTLKAIMAENACDIDAARSIRARLEVEADRAHFRKTGRHALDVISARDLARHPELAVQDTARPKLHDWKPEESLTTPKAQGEFILAAIEDGNPAFVAQSLAVVARARGDQIGSAIWDGIALGLKATASVPKAAAPTRRRTRRELAMA